MIRILYNIGSSHYKVFEVSLSRNSACLSIVILASSRLFFVFNQHLALTVKSQKSEQSSNNSADLFIFSFYNFKL